MASAIMMNSPVHQISLPPGCTAVVEDPITEKEPRAVITTSFVDLHQPRTLSPAASYDHLSPFSREGEEVHQPLMHSTPYPPSMVQRQLPTPPLVPDSQHQGGDSSGYASSQTPPAKIVNSSNLPATRDQQGVDETGETTIPDRDKWQFPIVDHSTANNHSGYDSDMSEPSPYAIVRNIIADVEPSRDPDRPHRTRDTHQRRESGYENIELRCLPSLPSSRPHSILERYVPPLQSIGPPIAEQPRSIKAALREYKGLCQLVQKQLRRADEFLQKKQLKEAITCLEWSLMQTSEYPQVQSLIWMLLGNAHVGVNDFSKASICHLHYLAFCRERNDFPGMTRAECSLGVAYMKLGLYKLAGRCFLQYLDNCHLLQDDKGISVAYNNLGLLSKILATDGFVAATKEGNALKAEEMLKSNLKRAVTYFEQHLGMEKQFGNVNKQANAFGNLGTCNELLKQYTQAIFCHNKRLEISRSIGDRSTESCVLCNLGNCFRAIGKLEEALQYYILNLELTRSIDDTSGEVVTLLNLGTTYELLNKIDQAIEWYTLYLSTTVKRNDVPGQARGFCILAALYHETGQLLKAHEYYKNMVSIFHELGERNAETSAEQFMEITRRAIEREKQQNKSSKWKKDKKRPSKKANTISRASGLTLSNPAIAETDGDVAHSRTPHPQRSRPPLAVDSIATLTPAQRTEFEKIKRQANMRSTDSLASACIFENPAYTHLQEECRNTGDLDFPGLNNRRPAGTNEYYQQWMQKQASRDEYNNAGREESVAASDNTSYRRATSPVFSDSGWSHTRTPGLSPDSHVDWSNYPYYYYPYTFGGGFNLGLHAQTAGTATHSLQRGPSPPYARLNNNGTPSPPIPSNVGGADVLRIDHSETDSDYDDIISTSIREEEQENENEDGDSIPHVGHHVEWEHGNDTAPPRQTCAQVMGGASSFSVFGSERHLQELEKIGHDFTHLKDDQEQLELSKGVDKEWEQWIKMQEDDALTRVVSMREPGEGKYRKKYRRKAQRSFSCRPAVSAPHLGSGDPVAISEEDLSGDTSPYTSDC